METLLVTVLKLSRFFAPQSLRRRLEIIVKLWWVLIITEILKLPATVQIPIDEIRYAVSSLADVAALKEVFIMKEYEWDVVDNPKIIIDLGGHCGDTAMYYHLTYPQAKIYVVEPLPENVSQMESNFKDIHEIKIVHAAIAASDGEVDLYATDRRNSLGGSLKKSKYTTHTVTVPALTLRSLFKKHAIERADLIKFDIEGSEEFLFVDQNPSFYADAYIGEIHVDLMQEITSAKEFAEQFETFNTVLEEPFKKDRYVFKAVKS